MPGETREEMIARWERDGYLDPNCPRCQEFYDSKLTPNLVFAPHHKAKDNCESGKRPHCTCDTCFQVLIVLGSLYACMSILWA
jgi:phage FluMu protein Com